MREKKFSYKDIKKAIDSVWRSHATPDSWNVPVLYKSSFTKYLKEKLLNK